MLSSSRLVRELYIHRINRYVWRYSILSMSTFIYVYWTWAIGCESYEGWSKSNDRWTSSRRTRSAGKVGSKMHWVLPVVTCLNLSQLVWGALSRCTARSRHCWFRALTGNLDFSYWGCMFHRSKLGENTTEIIGEALHFSPESTSSLKTVFT